MAWKADYILMRAILSFLYLVLCCGTVPAFAQSAATDSKLPYTIAERKPYFGNNPEDILRYIAEHIRYPALALRSRIQGTVLVGFVVGTSGSLENVHIVSGVHPSLDEEALRVVRNMPPWHPGIQAGRPVSMVFNVPITFRVDVPSDGRPAPALVVVESQSAEYAGTLEELNARLSFPAYPEEARTVQAQGRVVVLFDVDTTGRVTNVKSLPLLSAELQREFHQQPRPSTLHPSLLAAAVATVEALPNWKPGSYNGHPAVSQHAAVVTYRLPASTDTIYHLAERMPSFPGGEEALHQYVARKISYPAAAWRKKVQGEVLLYFVVNEQGQVEAPEILQSVHPDLDDEALRVARSLPAFQPAQQHGRPVKAGYMLPIGFARD